MESQTKELTNKMLLKKSYLVLLLFVFPITSHTGEIASFNEICNIYTEAQNSGMSRSQISDYIQNNIKTRVQPGDALDAHIAIFQLEPEKRYSIFKQTAEISLNRSWDCDALRTLMK